MHRGGVLAALAMVACGNRAPQSRNNDVAFALASSSTIATQGATKLAAAAHTCSISDGRVACWGYDHFRQLGHVAGGSCRGLGCEPTPCVVDPPEPFASVAAGENTTCAIGGTGNLWCWGEAHVGQLGPMPRERCGNDLNSWPCSEHPTKIGGLAKVRSVAIGYHICAAVETGEVWCWGGNDVNQLGTTTTDQCIANQAELVGNHGERIATPALACSRVPLRVPGVAGIVQVAAGRGHTCALTAGGSVLCWGDNGSGQLGIGNVARADSPTRVSRLDGVVGIAAAMSTTCAWRSDGRALCWGDNNSGQLGETTETCANGLACSRTPHEVLDDVVEVGVGFTHSCARRRDGSVVCWGLDADHQLGSPGPDTCGIANQACARTPQRVARIAKASGLAVGSGFACAVVADRIECWGRNVLGSLGDGTTHSRTRPVAISAARRCD